jgi:hypothetical protein
MKKNFIILLSLLIIVNINAQISDKKIKYIIKQLPHSEFLVNTYPTIHYKTGKTNDLSLIFLHYKFEDVDNYAHYIKLVQ